MGTESTTCLEMSVNGQAQYLNGKGLFAALVGRCRFGASIPSQSSSFLVRRDQTPSGFGSSGKSGKVGLNMSQNARFRELLKELRETAGFGTTAEQLAKIDAALAEPVEDEELRSKPGHILD